MAVRLLKGTLEDTGEVFFKGPDGIVILPVRKRAFYPFSAPGWTDLRLGFFLSLTDETADDTITGLSETLSGVTGSDERYWIGIRNGTSGLPRFEDGNDKVTFIGYTNSKPTNGPNEAADDSILTTSDGGVGTTNAFFWRPLNSTSNSHSAMIIDGETVLDASGTGLQQHFPQNVIGAGGYSVLLGMRLTRSFGIVTASFKSTTLSGDIMYSNAPTKRLILETLNDFPTSVQNLEAGIPLSERPNGFFFYWPFHNSRLRIHAVNVHKYA